MADPTGPNGQHGAVPRTTWDGGDWRGSRLRPRRFSDETWRNVLFDNHVIQRARFDRCVFENCEFKNCAIGFDVSYVGCRWTNCKFLGKYSSVGGPSLYEDCTFDNVALRSAMFNGTTLRRCSLSGKFQTLIWSNSPAGSTFNQVRFESCDMSRLTFSNVNIYGGVDLSTVRLPENGVRVFANPEGALQQALLSAASTLDGDEAIELNVMGGSPYDGQDPVVWDDYNLDFRSERTRSAFEEAVSKFEIAR